MHQLIFMDKTASCGFELFISRHYSCPTPNLKIKLFLPEKLQNEYNCFLQAWVMIIKPEHVASSNTIQNVL